MSSAETTKLKVKAEPKSPSSQTSATSKMKKAIKKEKKKSSKGGYTLNKDDIRYLTSNTRYDEKEIRLNDILCI